MFELVAAAGACITGPAAMAATIIYRFQMRRRNWKFGFWGCFADRFQLWETTDAIVERGFYEQGMDSEVV